MDNAGISIDDMRSGMGGPDSAWLNAGGTGGRLNYEAMGQTQAWPDASARFTSAGNFSSETGAPFMPPARGEGPPPLAKSKPDGCHGERRHLYRGRGRPTEIHY